MGYTTKQLNDPHELYLGELPALRASIGALEADARKSQLDLSVVRDQMKLWIKGFKQLEACRTELALIIEQVDADPNDKFTIHHHVQENTVYQRSKKALALSKKGA